MPSWRLAAVATLSCVAIASAQAGGRPDLALAALHAGQAAHVPAELLIQFKRDTPPAVADQVLDRIGARLIRALSRRSPSLGERGSLNLVGLPAHQDLADAIERLQAEPAVEFAEPNWIAHTHARQADPYYADGSQWGLYGDASPLQTNPFGSHAGDAYDAGKRCDASLHVGMIDTGIMVKHEDLAANIWVNPNDPLNGIDDDGNGLVDDVNGWNFRGDKAGIFAGREDNHGTHTSGTVAAVRLNGKGVAGVCDTARIIVAKAFGGSFGTGRTADIVEAIDYLTDLKTEHRINVFVTNNSWETLAYSQATYDAFARQTQAGILVVAAAGNGASNSDGVPSYPAGFDLPDIIAVAAITRIGELADYSNWGPTTVDIGAPGSEIYSTTVGRWVDGTPQPAYGSLDGTSMAAPHVTGAALLFKSLHPRATPADVKAALLASARPTPSLAGKTVSGGRLDVSGF